MRRVAVLLLPLMLAGCFLRGPPAEPVAPHYVLGPPYEINGYWFYPQASYSAEQSGLAIVYGGGHPRLTADGERLDQTALAAAHQTLQLPAIARVTNLENGRQVVVRVNDRGPAGPGRLIAATRRTAELLGFPPSGVARIRLEVLPAESRAAVEAAGGDPNERLALATAPRGRVEASDLPPAGTPPVIRPLRESFAASAKDTGWVPVAPPLRMPEQVTLVPVRPTSLWIEMGTFSQREFAERQRARVAALRPRIESLRTGREQTYRVRIGPLSDVGEADAVLVQVIRAGVPDARIVVE
ncbi:MAG: septal ring lytic transglycosylase RlpA family protein [Acetobacteraceae bacterium]|nr:septal ring lytic transglycosylase RlpA family protein [Acetobacteraceae bacterium]